MTEIAARPAVPEPEVAPASLSRRRIMVEALPPVFRERATADAAPPFVERWVQACEEVLDPVVALLDSLPAHVDPRTAPDDMVDVLLACLGMRWPDAIDPAARRRLLLNATRISETRGTLRGLRLVVRLVLPDCGIVVRQSGRATAGQDPRSRGPDAAAPSVQITCRVALTPTQRAALEAVVEDQRPAHVPCRIDVGPAPVP